MEYKLTIDPQAEESIHIIARQRSALTEELENVILRHSSADQILGYRDEEMKILPFSRIDCFTVLEGKTYAFDARGEKYRVKLRLYELEQRLPGNFVRINKSAIGNLNRIDRFAEGFGGSVDAVFVCGYREYISRRCFANIRRRLEKR